MKKVEEYYKKASQAVKKKRTGQKQINQLKATNEPLKTKTSLLKYQLFPPQLEWNPFWPL